MDYLIAFLGDDIRTIHNNETCKHQNNQLEARSSKDINIGASKNQNINNQNIEGKCVDYKIPSSPSSPLGAFLAYGWEAARRQARCGDGSSNRTTENVSVFGYAPSDVQA